MSRHMEFVVFKDIAAFKKGRHGESQNAYKQGSFASDVDISSALRRCGPNP